MGPLKLETQGNFPAFSPLGGPADTYKYDIQTEEYKAW